jgi:hypothetical protein
MTPGSLDDDDAIARPMASRETEVEGLAFLKIGDSGPFRSRAAAYRPSPASCRMRPPNAMTRPARSWIGNMRRSRSGRRAAVVTPAE